MFLLEIAQASEKAAETAAEAGGISAIGLDARSFVLQVINFAILLLLLKKFAYKPILKILEDRRIKIDESLKTAREIEAIKDNLDKEKNTILKDAHAKAQSILEQSKHDAREILGAVEQKALERDEQLLKETKARLDQEVNSVKRSLIGETVNLVQMATEKVLQRKLDDATDRKIVKDALADVEGYQNSGNL